VRRHHREAIGQVSGLFPAGAATVWLKKCLSGRKGNVKLYAESPRLRSRQLITDAVVVLWILAWILAGRLLSDLVNELGAPGRAVEDAGANFVRALTEASERTSDLPVVGPALQDSFASVSDAGRSLARAGVAQQQAVNDIAVLLGALFAAVAIGYVLIRYLPNRVAWIREATAADRLRVNKSDLYLFALRAMTRRPLHELRRATPDPAGAFASGDYRGLAALELDALGLRAEQYLDPAPHD
jgi:hypothetical protein